MSEPVKSERVVIRQLPTGVPGLDEVLCGGIPEFSFNVIAGAPGVGKTTMAQQILFALAGPERPGLYFTVLGEPAIKMLRYQQQFTFFDLAKVEDSIHMVNLGVEAATSDLETLLKRIVLEVEQTNPGIVVVDSFRSIVEAMPGSPECGVELQHFVQRLAMKLTAWQATTFLVGEYAGPESSLNPVFTVADGLFWLNQSLDRNSMVRKLQVIKSRGHDSIPGLHTMRITNHGLQVFPRTIMTHDQAAGATAQARAPRLATGIPALDEMLGGGIPRGNAALVIGPSGAGKTVLATEFIVHGASCGEPGIIAVFEKRPVEYSQLGAGGERMSELVRAGAIKLIHTRPLDLSIDEMLSELIEAIRAMKAERVLIDSLNGFEMALAPTFREDFRESLYRMAAVLTGMGVTLMLTSEIEDCYTDLRFSPHGTAFLADVIIMQRYIELAGKLDRGIAVVKLRACAHSTELRRYTISDRGIAIGEPFAGYAGLLTGRPEKAPA